MIGPSGSGKSSLLTLMGGLERATGGTIAALGQNLGPMDEDALARFRSENIRSGFSIFPPNSDNDRAEKVATPLELAGATDAFELATAELEVVGLGHRLEHYPAQMSGGEQQRVALARAAAPHLLLADEPAGNLDEASGAAIMDLLFGLQERHGATLVRVPHARALAERCDRVVQLQGGRLAA